MILFLVSLQFFLHRVIPVLESINRTLEILLFSIYLLEANIAKSNNTEFFRDGQLYRLIFIDLFLLI